MCERAPSSLVAFASDAFDNIGEKRRHGIKRTINCHAIEERPVMTRH
jgi:hypothetical protein